LLLLLGCGGDGDNESENEARRAAQAYVDALAEGDAAAACEFQRLPRQACIEMTEKEIRQGDAFGADFGRVERVRLSANAARVNFSTGAFLLLSNVGDGWKIGAPEDQAVGLGAPKAPETERCSPRQEKRLREQSEKAGIPVDPGPLFCERRTTTDK
jgi:hypothetical protein